MTHARRFRFAVDFQHPFPDRSWPDSAREAESLGYSTMFVPDHFDEGIGPFTAMATAAAATTTLNVGALVLDCDFRHPTGVARELASIDLLSEGRLEVGLGAGWKRLDYDHSGIPMDPPKVRVDRLIEHTQVLKGLFAAYYHAIHPHKLVFDTNRAWCSKLPTLAKLYPQAKVICCVRHVPWIMDSIERLIRDNGET